MLDILHLGIYILQIHIFSCPMKPRHMSAYIDKFNYKLPYTDIFGGVSAISVEHYKKVIWNVFMHVLHDQSYPNHSF